MNRSKKKPRDVNALAAAILPEASGDESKPEPRELTHYQLYGRGTRVIYASLRTAFAADGAA